MKNDLEDFVQANASPATPSDSELDPEFDAVSDLEPKAYLGKEMNSEDDASGSKSDSA